MNTAASAFRQVAPTEAALEARFGLRVAARLSEANQELPHDISERLRVARQLALARIPAKVAARQAAQTAGMAVISVSGASATAGGFMLGDDRSPWWVRLGSLLPVLVLLAGIVFIHEWTDQEQLSAAATIDASLLSDSLPPDAYTDPGFDEFLRTPEFSPAAQAGQ